MLTDGETIPVDLETLSERLRDGRVATIFVQIWRGDGAAVFDDLGEDASRRTGPTPRPAGRCGSSQGPSARR